MDQPNENPSTSPAVGGDTAASRKDGAPKNGPQRFDFRHPVFLSSPEWRKLKMEVEEFVESLGALLSTYLRLDFTLQLGKLETKPFNEFTATLPASTHLALFKLEPLRGVSVLEIRPAIGLAIVDRLLGGPGKPAVVDRDLTEMEVALLDQTVQLMLGEWCKQWAEFQDLRGEIMGHENNPKFLQSSSGETTVLVLTIEARMGEVEGQIQFAFPYSSFSTIVNKLTQSSGSPSPAVAVPEPVMPKWNHGLDDLPMSLVATWPSFKVATKVLMNLKPGDVIDLQAEGSEKVELRIGKAVKFKGRLGSRDGKWAIQINSICKV